ncbi:MAG: thioredoxin [Pseudanabaenaceae cyanobacterium SKYGB_i_bin29]|nr:thioredoxin [Pseudanabaenaceae cyanobacterium SKYG29]MDW8421081.1 thioredoxin [Pseudanabaenaceae cyanobacterium SKYGB_i_bin29]
MAIKKQFSSFAELLQSSPLPILVDFYAPWCGPCQLMAPILEKVGAQVRDKVQIVKINTDQYPDIASQYHVRALPTFIIFRDGKPIERFEGAMTADQLLDKLKRL